MLFTVCYLFRTLFQWTIDPTLFERGGLLKKQKVRNFSGYDCYTECIKASMEFYLIDRQS